MKYSLLLNLTLAALFGSLASCKKDKTEPTDPLVFSFQLLNEQGQETSVFAPGQNIIFHFEARNTTDSTMYFLTRIVDINQDKLLAVYKGTPDQHQLVGRPYEVLAQTFIGGPYQTSAHAAYDFGSFTISWLESSKYPGKDPFYTHAPNAPLPKGHYYASFTPSFTWYQKGVTTTETTSPPLIREFDVR